MFRFSIFVNFHWLFGDQLTVDFFWLSHLHQGNSTFFFGCQRTRNFGSLSQKKIRVFPLDPHAFGMCWNQQFGEFRNDNPLQLWDPVVIWREWFNRCQKYIVCLHGLDAILHQWTSQKEKTEPPEADVQSPKQRFTNLNFSVKQH